MSVNIQLRRDTAAAWTAANPILAQGEIGFEYDTLKIKFGDGATAWVSLAYYSAGAGAPSAANYLVGTADAGLSAEIVVGATPNGELGGTWGAITVDASHSGSTHAAAQAAAEATAAAAAGVHAAAADPHTGYQKESEKAAASGYASLDAGTKIPIAQVPTGTSAVTVALGDAAAALDATHAGAADPHTGYQKESEKDANSGYAGLGAAQGTRDGTKFLRDDGTWQAASGGSHPDLATHDTLGLATQTELDTHAAAGDPHAGYRLESAAIDTADLAARAVTHAKYQAISEGVILGRALAAGSGDITALTAAQANSVLAQTVAINFVIDGGGAVITTGVKGVLEIPFACTIVQWTLLADQSGSIVVDIWKDTYANYPPVIGDVITASAKPTITTATKGQSSTLTGWTTAVAAGDVLLFNVNSITTCQRVTLSLKVTRT